MGVPKVANGADLEANGEVATEAMKEDTEAVMLTANGEVTEAAMEVTEEVTPQDLEARPHGVWPEETSEECVVGVVWEEAGVDPVAPETSLTKKRYKQKEREKKRNFKNFSRSESALFSQVQKQIPNKKQNEISNQIPTIVRK